MVILNSTLLMLVLGTVLSVVLAVFARVFEVKEDPDAARIADILPSYNCGSCGYPGCRQYAQALIRGHVPSNRCAPGGKETREKIDLILGARTGNPNQGQTVKTV